MKILIWIVCMMINAWIIYFFPDLFAAEHLSEVDKVAASNAAVAFLVAVISTIAFVFGARKLCSLWERHVDRKAAKTYKANGSASHRTCSNCGEPLPVISRVCPNCGTLSRENR